MNLLHTLLAFLVTLTALVFVHELGHYAAARACGVLILRFSIGFGRPLVSFRRGRDATQWVISAVPLGGYVKMLDERDPPEAGIDPHALPRAFSRQSLPRRAFIVAAGPLANFVLAVVLYGALNLAGVEEPAAVLDAPVAGSPAAIAGFEHGDRIVRIDGDEVRSWNELRLRTIGAVVDHRAMRVEFERDGSPGEFELVPGTISAADIEGDLMSRLGLRLEVGPVTIASLPGDGPAARAGLRAGDHVLAIDGHPIARATELIDAVRASPGRAMTFELERAGTRLDVSVTPGTRSAVASGDQPARETGFINAAVNNRVAMTVIRYAGTEAFGRAVIQTRDMSWFTLRMLGKMLSGELTWRTLSGPVSIADYAGQSARIGWRAFTAFLALLSISLGVLNLLPIPILDGGHLVYYGLEALRGRPLSERFMELSQKAGLAVVGLMMVIALFNDLTRLIGP